MKKITKRFLSAVTAAAMSVSMLAGLSVQAADSAHAEFVSEFQNPSNEYRPKVRWWWPGGDVTSEELIRELNLLHNAGFGGAEMQPFDYSLNDEALKNPDSPIKDFMTDSFLGKVSDLLSEAQKLDMIMDINMGSGYCAGASFVPLEDNEHTLMSADITVHADQKNAAIPQLSAHNYPYELLTPNKASYIKPGWHTMNYMPENAELLTLYAAKVVSGERNPDYKVLNDTVTLDLSTVELITDYNKDAGTFSWTCPDTTASWQIIAIYGMPVGSNPIGSVEVGAPGETAYMVDVLNYAATQRYYQNWFAQLQPILKYTQDGTLRAAFNDSYEFFAQRYYTDGLLDTFQKVNGYQIEKYMPTLLMPAKDQVANFFIGNRAPEFSFADEANDGINDRINYDYNKSVNQSLMDGWYAASVEAFEDSPLLYRQQGYNPPMDRIKATQYADIPEAENNTIVTNKVISSGAHFYDKNTVSAETFVFYTDEDGAGNFKITPETYRQQADLMITSGVNEMIYHGFPYVYNDEDGSYGVQNWSAFCSPYSGYDIPTTFSESDPFWPYVKNLNDYVSRLQFLMKQGDPSVDVLVYLPLFASETSAKYTTVTNQLNASGIAWDYVNEELLESASYTGGHLMVNDKEYDALILPNVDTIELSAMQAVNALSEAGAPIAVYGVAPSKQPGYQDGKYAEADAQVAALAAQVTARSNSPLVTDETALSAFTANYANPEITYEANAALNFIRRDYGDMGNLIFVRNTSANATDYRIVCGAADTKAYVLDARTGEIHETAIQDGTVTGSLDGMDSTVLLFAENSQFSAAQLTAGDPLAVQETSSAATLDNWTLRVDGQDVQDYTASGAAALGMWRDNDALKYCADAGLYTTTFTLDQVDSTKDYILQLGTLYGVPEVSVNGGAFRSVPMAPYELDISKDVQEGENTVTVKLVVPLRNRLIGYAVNGEDGNGLNKSHYTQFASAKLAKSGMTAPASVIAVQTDRLPAATVSVAGETDITVDQDVLSYTVRVANASGLATATVTLESEGLVNPTVEAAEGWYVLNTVTAENEGVTTTTAVLCNNAGMTSEDAAAILTVTGQTTGQVGSASLTLTSAVLSAYQGEGEAFVDVIYGETTVTTTIHYSVYDVNEDGVVDQLDITRAQRAYGAGKEDAAWNARADVNSDGVVDINDLILILNNYTK